MGEHEMGKDDNDMFVLPLAFANTILWPLMAMFQLQNQAKQNDIFSGKSSILFDKCP